MHLLSSRRLGFIASLALALLVAVPLTLPARAPAPPASEQDKIAEYIPLLRSKNVEVRRQAALALGEMGPKAKSAVPALREALRDSEESVQSAVAEALRRITGTEVPARQIAEEVAKLREVVGKLEERANVQARETEKLLAQSARQEARLLAQMELQTKEAVRLKALLEQSENSLKDLTAKLEATRVARIQAEQEAQVLAARNRQLEQRLRELEAASRQKKEAEPVPPKPRNAPSEDIEGVIKAVEERTGLVKLSVGADGGLQVGHQVHAFRLQPTPKYLGVLEIVAISPTEAVARPKDRRSLPSKGDQFATRMPAK